jgi:hypothetical protein
MVISPADGIIKMPVSYVTSLKSSRMAAVITAIDISAPAAVIEIGTAGMAAILVTITLSDPSFTESAGIITMAGAPKSGIASGTGTAAAARIRTGGAADVVTGLTVGTSLSDINLNSTSITTGQTVTLTSGTLIHAA